MTDEFQKPNEEKQNDEKPLVPRTAAGAAIIGVPLASIMTFAGWAGQRLLALDEDMVRVQNELDNRQEVVDKSHEMQGRVQEIETLLSTAKQTLENVEKLGIGLDERLIRVETQVEDFREDQGRTDLDSRVVRLETQVIDLQTEQARIREHLDVSLPIEEKDIPFISKEPGFDLTPKVFDYEN